MDTQEDFISEVHLLFSRIQYAKRNVEPLLLNQLEVVVLHAVLDLSLGFIIEDA